MQLKVNSGLLTPADPAVRESAKTWFILGRSDNTTKLAGKRGGPAEIEEVPLKMPEVAEAAAIGVEGGAKGQKLVVVLVRAAGASEDRAVRASTVQRHVNQRLGRPFRLSAMHLVSQLPRTCRSNGMRRVTRSVYCGQRSRDLSSLGNPVAIDEFMVLAAA